MKYVGVRQNRRVAILAGAIAVTLCSGIATAGPNSTSLILEASRSLASPGVTGAVFAEKLTLAPRKEKSRYTVVLKEAPLATYAGTTSGFSAVPRDQKGHLQVRSSEAASYVSHLRDKQAQFVSQVETQIGRPLSALMQFQHALNGVVLELTAEEADALAKRPDVMMVDIEKMQPLLTDRGPAFIGADKIWDGTATGGVKSEGEGVVIGDIDSGINFTSPSFAGIGPIDGYHHVNPLGAGNYLGQCAPAGVDVGNCNDKLVGLYDFVNVVCTAAGNPCGAAGTWTEEPSATDSNGHGSHTASTTVGNHANVSLSGGNFTISGVAPHASIVAYDACYTRVSDGGGLCPTTSTTASANQAVADGLVDIITFSIGGGTSPWTDSTSLAFLGAQNAGIFVVAAAGNDGPGAGTVSHVEPWVATAAASTHDRVLGYTFNLNAPGTPPANTINLAVRPGGNPQPTGDVVNLPIKQSPGFANGNNDGCTAFADPHTFDRDVTSDERIFGDGFEGTAPAAIIQKGIAVLHLDGSNSGCGSGARRTNALAAGASAVIYVDIGYLNLGASSTSYSMTMPQWNDISTQINTDPTHATASILLPLKSFLSGQGDVVADFSSRGPAAGIGGQAIVKPEIAAPGVAILAAYMGAPGSVAIEDGTSMATPHIAGAAALLRSLHPTWTPTQIRSAMMLTAKTTMTKQDGNPAGIWERGAGRIDLVAAAKAGLILDETGANYLAANPSTGGKISTLNLPSMAESNCVGPCTFTRTVRSARTGAVTYTLSINGLPAGSASVLPTSFTISTSGTKSFTVTVQGDMLPSGVYQLGDLTLTPSDPNVPTQHFPIAVQPGGPAIQVSANSVSGTSSFGGPTVQQPLAIKNIGNPTLNWAVGTTASPVTLLNTATTTNGEGYGAYSVPANNYYGGQNFDVVGSVNMTTLRANGFLFPAATMSAANTSQVTFSIFGDSPGVPNGAPENVGTAPVWTYSGPVGGAGISITGGNLALNLAAPGVPALNLTTGRYWFVPYPTMTTTGDFDSAANPGWAWRTSSAAQVGNPTKQIHPADASPAWVDVSDGSKIMSAIIQGNIDCTQPSWVSYAPTLGALGYNATSNMTVTFDPTGLFAGSYGGTLCITSNATNTPTAIVGVNFTVTGTPPVAPTLSEGFTPNSVATGANSTLTITLNNANSLPAKLLSNFTDTFPANLTASAASTTCTGGTGASVGAGNGSVILAKDALIPAAGSCTVTATVSSSVAASYNNAITAGALHTNAGDNAAASASLTVVGISAPTLTKAFAPASVQTGVASQLTITLSNSNGTPATLTGALTDTFPAGMVLTGTPAAATTCVGGTGVSTTSGSITLASAAQIPANGSCTVKVNVTSAVQGSYANSIPAGGLATNDGSNASAANASLTVTPDPFFLYSNLGTDASANLAVGTTTLVGSTRYSPMICDKLTLAQPGQQLITSFSVWLRNNNATTTSVTSRISFYDDSGASGGPGVKLGNTNQFYYGGGNYATAITAGSYKLNAAPFGYTATYVPEPAGGPTANANVWACVNYSSTTVTDAVMSQLGMEKFTNAPTAGSTTDLTFLSTGGANFTDNPPGALVSNTGGTANVLGWELKTLGNVPLVDSYQVTNAGAVGTSGYALNATASPGKNFSGFATTIDPPSSTWNLTGMVLYPQCSVTAAYTDVQATIQFWDTFAGSAANPVFSNSTPIASTTVDLGAVACTANNFLQFQTRFASPIGIGSSGNLGMTVKYSYDLGAGLVTAGDVTSVLNNVPVSNVIAVGTNASPSAQGWYASTSNRGDLNFQTGDYVGATRQNIVVRVFGKDASVPIQAGINGVSGSVPVSGEQAAIDGEPVAKTSH